MRERERDRDKYICSIVNPFWNMFLRILLSFQKKDNFGRVPLIRLFFKHSLLSLSLYFVPGGGFQVQRIVTESVKPTFCCLLRLYTCFVCITDNFLVRNVRKWIFIFFQKLTKTLFVLNKLWQIDWGYFQRNWRQKLFFRGFFYYLHKIGIWSVNSY